MTWQDIDNAERAEFGGPCTVWQLAEHAHHMANECTNTGQLADFYRLRAWAHAANALIAQVADVREFYRARVEACLRNAASEASR